MADLSWLPADIKLPCQRSNRDWWISEDPEDREAAQHGCARCPWQADCLAYGIAIEAEAGVFGGRDFLLPEPAVGTLFEEGAARPSHTTKTSSSPCTTGTALKSLNGCRLTC